MVLGFFLSFFFLSFFLISFFFFLVHFEIFLRERRPTVSQLPSDRAKEGWRDGWRDEGMDEQQQPLAVRLSIHPSTPLQDPSRCPFKPYRVRRFPRRERRTGAEPARLRRAALRR